MDKPNEARAGVTPKTSSQNTLPRAPLNNLPAEVLHRIVTLLDNENLVRSATTCTHYYAVAEAQLYRDVDLEVDFRRWEISHYSTMPKGPGGEEGWCECLFCNLKWHKDVLLSHVPRCH